MVSEQEIWKTIDDRPKYEISNYGRVKNKRTGKILGDRFDKDGYQDVYLYDDSGKGGNKKVHRLVASAFLAQDPNKTYVNHKNGIKTDNHVENLEWCTSSENTIHAYNTGLLKANMRPAINARTKISTKDEIEIRKMREKGMLLKDIAQVFDISVSTASYHATRTQ